MGGDSLVLNESKKALETILNEPESVLMSL